MTSHLDPSTILEVRGLGVSLDTAEGRRALVKDVDLSVLAGESVGIVGESGSGKSVTLRALIGLSASTMTVTGSVKVMDEELVGRIERDLVSVRGTRIAMVFQDPLASLDPIRRIGWQVAEGLRLRGRLDRRQARRRTHELLEEVGLRDVAKIVKQYPHELSGGMRQRVAIAIALACEPDVVLCDEPTTALDVTVQAEILKLLRARCRDLGAAVVFVSHDLAVVSQMCESVCVMYDGRIVESGPTPTVLSDPRHAYTASLLQALPVFDGRVLPQAIPGEPPRVGQTVTGCSFHPRCPVSRSECTTGVPPLRSVGGGQASACVRALDPGPILLARPGASA